MELLQTLRKIRACKGDVAAQLLFEAYVKQEVDAERELIALEFDRRAAPGVGFYEPHEPAEIVRGLEA